MTASVSDLAGILRAAGLTVSTAYTGPGETDGGFSPLGLILHHDAAGLSYTDGWGGKDDTSIAAYMAKPGNNGAQFWVGRSGTWYILAAGRMWHAGTGSGYGNIPANAGNTYAYGIETDYGPVRPGWSGPTVSSEGYTWPAWDAAHIEAINVGSRALAKALGLNTFCGHKEYAPDRKIDPANLSLDDWRAAINGPAPKPPVPPTPDPDFMEWIMALPGAPANLTYQQLTKDVANEVARMQQQVAADKLGAAHGLGVVINRLNHGQNYDGTRVGK